MTGKQVSAQQVRLLAAFNAEPETWFGGSEIERKTELPGSTVRHFLLNFFRLQMLDRVDVFGGYRYRLSSTAPSEPYYQRILEASLVIRPEVRTL